MSVCCFFFLSSSINRLRDSLNLMALIEAITYLYIDAIDDPIRWLLVCCWNKLIVQLSSCC